jgi:hypothetical protein
MHGDIGDSEFQKSKSVVSNSSFEKLGLGLDNG